MTAIILKVHVNEKDSTPLEWHSDWLTAYRGLLDYRDTLKACGFDFTATGSAFNPVWDGWTFKHGEKMTMVTISLSEIKRRNN